MKEKYQNNGHSKSTKNRVVGKRKIGVEYPKITERLCWYILQPKRKEHENER